jgi:succinate dehydrogenase / fumarate reductase membrane anchor subunit
MVMVKSVLSVSHQGLRDWIWQRVSAVILALYTFGIVTFIAIHPGLDFATWQNLFSHFYVKIATIIFLLAMMIHAWVGIRIVITDYIKCYITRSIVSVSIFLALAACAIAALLILWGV